MKIAVVSVGKDGCFASGEAGNRLIPTAAWSHVVQSFSPWRIASWGKPNVLDNARVSAGQGPRLMKRLLPCERYEGNLLETFTKYVVVSILRASVSVSS